MEVHLPTIFSDKLLFSIPFQNLNKCHLNHRDPDQDKPVTKDEWIKTVQAPHML